VRGVVFCTAKRAQRDAEGCAGERALSDHQKIRFALRPVTTSDAKHAVTMNARRRVDWSVILGAGEPMPAVRGGNRRSDVQALATAFQELSALDRPDAIAKRAVEFARDAIGLERVGMFLIDSTERAGHSSSVLRNADSVMNSGNSGAGDPLHGVTLEVIVQALLDRLGWEELGQLIDIRCFQLDPSVKSSLKFLRRTPWARKKDQNLYLYGPER
jgi:hypothetical protein